MMTIKNVELEEAEKYVDNMYQKRFEECGYTIGNTIYMENHQNLKFTDLELASIRLLREVLSLNRENESLKSIKKEAREYLEERYDKDQKVMTHTFDKDNIQELLEILDKENK